MCCAGFALNMSWAAPELRLLSNDGTALYTGNAVRNPAGPGTVGNFTEATFLFHNNIEAIQVLNETASLEFVLPDGGRSMCVDKLELLPIEPLQLPLSAVSQSVAQTGQSREGVCPPFPLQGPSAPDPPKHSLSQRRELMLLLCPPPSNAIPSDPMALADPSSFSTPFSLVTHAYIYVHAHVHCVLKCMQQSLVCVHAWTASECIHVVLACMQRVCTQCCSCCAAIYIEALHAFVNIICITWSSALHGQARFWLCQCLHRCCRNGQCEQPRCQHHYPKLCSSQW